MIDRIRLAPVDGTGSGLDADTIDGGVEAPHVAGAAGEPPFLFDWVATPDQTPPSFYRDPFGVVRLRGAADVPAGYSQLDTPIFVLPEGYRAGGVVRIPVSTESDELPATAIVLLGGHVVIFDSGGELSTGDLVALDAISFRCSPSGANGCP